MSSSSSSASSTTSSSSTKGPFPIPDRPGFSLWTISDTKFEIENKYRLIRTVGTGAYGVVVSAEDTTNGQKIAIKKIPHAFHDLTDALRILREIRLMRHLNHENILGITDLGPPPSPSAFEDVYIMSELLETDLHRIIYSRQELTDEHLQFFIYQILIALKYMHSANVIHRDLKPSNILLNADCTLKICDFGLARGVDVENPDLTEYVVTRWYRAPEIMLSTTEYTKAIDVWAVGCILAELLGTKPLFPGDDYIHQLKLIVDILGSPSEEDMEFIKSARARTFMQKQSGKPSIPFVKLFPHASSTSIDLLTKMLMFNPSKRITVDEALAHPYFSTLHSEEDEPLCSQSFDFSFESLRLDKGTLQSLMLDQIEAFHPDVRRLPTVNVSPSPSSSSFTTSSSLSSSSSSSSSMPPSQTFTGTSISSSGASLPTGEPSLASGIVPPTTVASSNDNTTEKGIRNRDKDDNPSDGGVYSSNVRC